MENIITTSRLALFRISPKAGATTGRPRTTRPGCAPRTGLLTARPTIKAVRGRHNGAGDGCGAVATITEPRYAARKTRSRQSLASPGVTVSTRRPTAAVACVKAGS